MRDCNQNCEGFMIYAIKEITANLNVALTFMDLSAPNNSHLSSALKARPASKHPQFLGIIELVKSCSVGFRNLVDVVDAIRVIVGSCHRLDTHASIL